MYLLPGLKKPLDYTFFNNGTNYFFRKNYAYSTRDFKINGNEVAPEFPSLIAVLILRTA